MVSVSASGTNWWAQIQLSDSVRGQIVRQMFLGPLRRGVRRTLLHVPAEAGTCHLLFIREASAFSQVRLRPLTRAYASLLLLWEGWRSLPAALRGDRLGVTGRVRTMLGQAPGRKGQAPPYALWCKLYEKPGSANNSPIDFRVVVAAGEGASKASEASLPADRTVIAAPADWESFEASTILLIASGEVLAPHALSRFTAAMSEAPHADFICADADSIDASGTRHSPLFKPQPGPVFLESGLATAGACLFRRKESWAGLPLDADTARLILARRCDPDRMIRIASILTHLPSVPVARRADSASPKLPRSPSVSVVIPTSLRSKHVLRCLRTILGTTSYQNIQVVLAVSAIDRADKVQASLIQEAARLPGVRILQLVLPEFNFSRVNNLAIEQIDSEFVLLMNDDVVPQHADWLERMMARALAPGVGAVGARLLYGNDRVQHAGVIMGLAGLCEHADRLMDAADPGDHGRAFIDREVSAVTAACLLMSTELYRKLTGFDEAFAIALNDVDLCMRIRATGARIVYAANAMLYHYESLSLGRHYKGVRATLEGLEVRLLRNRWAATIADDPSYNPQASLEPGREWQPAYPPRLPFSEHCNFDKSATKC